MNIKSVSKICIDSIKRGGKVFCCGNGGSAAEAQHFVAELVGKYKHERRALPAIALTTDTSILTAIANDFGFEYTFVRQLEALTNKGDVLVALSTSGKSKNVLKAIEWATANDLSVIDIERLGKTTSEIQENQLRILHKLAELIEKAFI